MGGKKKREDHGKQIFEDDDPSSANYNLLLSTFYLQVSRLATSHDQDIAALPCSTNGPMSEFRAGHIST